MHPIREDRYICWVGNVIRSKRGVALQTLADLSLSTFRASASSFPFCTSRQWPSTAPLAASESSTLIAVAMSDCYQMLEAGHCEQLQQR